MKANTVEQYHILRWLEENFHTSGFVISFIDRCNVRICDKTGEEAIVTYTDGKIELN